MQSQMVMARKYELLVRDTREKGAYEVEGQRKMKHDWKLVSRNWVEQRNSQVNNEHYEINEELTAEAMVTREENIKLQAQERKQEKVGFSDLVGALAGAVVKGNDTPPVIDKTPKIDEELEAARVRYEEMFGEAPHHAKKLATINKAIEDKAE